LPVRHRYSRSQQTCRQNSNWPSRQ
jgi:hypothetical protein